MVGGTEAREEGLRSTCDLASLLEAVLGTESLVVVALALPVKVITLSWGAVSVLPGRSLGGRSLSPPASLSRASRMADIVRQVVADLKSDGFMWEETYQYRQSWQLGENGRREEEEEDRREKGRRDQHISYTCPLWRRRAGRWSVRHVRRGGPLLSVGTT